MEKFPLVSAIITTHNRLELLKKAIESVKKQSYNNIELIVVDDNSIDGTYEWCKKQGFKYIHISEKESCGGNHARNVGILEAKGKYVAFLDDDDYWLPEKIKKQVEKIEETGNEVVHCARIVKTIEANTSYEREFRYPLYRYEGDLKKKILYRIVALTSGMLILKKAIEEVGFFDENCKFWQEYELTIRLAQRKPFDLINEPLFIYLINQNDKNRLTNKYDGWIHAVKYIKKKHSVLYKKQNSFEKLRYKILFWGDSSTRLDNMGVHNLKYKSHKLLSKYLNYPFRLYDKLYFTLKN